MAARSTGLGSSTATLESPETRVSSMVDWQKEMFYINKDLRELLIITIILFVLLFIAGFLI
jgi:hypothetical protein